MYVLNKNNTLNFIYLDQMSGSWNMDECGDQMAQGTFWFKWFYNNRFL